MGKKSGVDGGPSYSIQGGEAHVVIGPINSGKSSYLKDIILGVPRIFNFPILIVVKNEGNNQLNSIKAALSSVNHASVTYARHEDFAGAVEQFFAAHPKTNYKTIVVDDGTFGGISITQLFNVITRCNEFNTVMLLTAHVVTQTNSPDLPRLFQSCRYRTVTLNGAISLAKAYANHRLDGDKEDKADFIKECLKEKQRWTSVDLYPYITHDAKADVLYDTELMPIKRV